MRRGIVITVLAAALAACGGDDGTTLSGALAVVTTHGPTTTATASTATTSAMTVTTTSTSLPMSSIEDQIRADFHATIQARLACGVNPADCAYGDVAMPGSPADARLRALMSSRLKAGLRGVPQPGDFSIEVLKIDVRGGEVALVETCGHDGRLLVDIRDPSHPADDVIFDDSVVTTHSLFEMRFDGVRWLQFDGLLISQSPGVRECVG